MPETEPHIDSGAGRSTTGQIDACAEHFCLYCGHPFTPTREWQGYCRPSCRYAAARQKHDAKIRQEALLPFGLVSECRQPLTTTEGSSQVAGTVADERGRLKGQAARILARLQRGPATNRELAQIALKYTGRLSELKDRGNRIEVVSRDYHTGLTVYVLRPPAQQELGEC